MKRQHVHLKSIMLQDFENLYKCISSWTPNSEMIKAKVIAVICITNKHMIIHPI